MVEGLVFGDRVMNYINHVEVVCEQSNLSAIIQFYAHVNKII